MAKSLVVPVKSLATRTFFFLLVALRPFPDLLRLIRLPIPSRDTVASSPVVEYAPPNGATSNYTRVDGMRPGSPVMEDPSVELEKELAGTHLHQ